MLISCGLSPSTPVLSQGQVDDGASVSEYAPSQVLVRFSPKENGQQRNSEERNQILDSVIRNAKTKRNYRLIPGLTLVELPEGVSVLNAVEVFKQRGEILYAEPNYKIYLASNPPNDEYFDDQWNMHNTGQSDGTQDADIDAPEAWDTDTSSSVIIAVLDTGIDYNHPDLTSNMWVNSAELNGDPNYDDDNNGYEDDINGYDCSG